MCPGTTPQPQSYQQDPDSLTRVGGWLFKHRTWLPLPIAMALLAMPVDMRPMPLWTGAAIVGAGELLRLWAVHHIGAISRTRSDRLGPLVAAGPFAWVRNPLYLGNIAIWTGFTISADLAWLAPLVAMLLAIEYRAIVRWEERLLDSRLGEHYRAYASHVPRWIPWRSTPDRAPSDTAFSLRETLFSERGTFIAIGAGYAILWLKSRVV